MLKIVGGQDVYMHQGTMRIRSLYCIDLGHVLSDTWTELEEQM